MRRYEMPKTIVGVEPPLSAEVSRFVSPVQSGKDHADILVPWALSNLSIR